MNAMSSFQLFESLTQVGIQPDVAHRVEREIENSIHLMHEQSLGEKLARFVTRDDFHLEINKLRHEMHTEINKLRQELHISSWRQIGFNFAFFSAAVAILKYAP